MLKVTKTSERQSVDLNEPKRYMYFATFGDHSITVRELPCGSAQIERKVHGHSHLHDLIWESNLSMDQWVSIQDSPDLYIRVDED